MIQDFSPWGVYYLEITCGENARAALDYTLHYRSPRMMGIDADYSMSQDYRAQSWPTFVVVDAEGVIRFHGFDSDQNLAGVRRCLKNILRATEKDPKQVLASGVAYPAEVLACRKARRDRSPRLAFDRSGNANVVYYSNVGGTNAVYVRRFDPQGALKSEDRLSPAGLESYAPDCVFDDAGTLWVTWSARPDRFFDIFVQSHNKGEPPRTERLSSSDDDAMSPRIAAGAGGALTVTYYKWAKLNGISRDRNVFARSYDPARRSWGSEVEISPLEPKVEDHTDPDVVMDAQGGAWIVWSYDYHPQLFRKPVSASQPTIFAARFSSNTAAPAVLVGATGRLRDAIDLFPSVALDSAGVLWCAWDCSEPHRNIQLARRSPGDEAFNAVASFGKAICSTPKLSATRDGRLLLAWSEHAAVGGWQGKVALLKDGQPLETVTLTEKADVLFPQAQQSPDGQYWVVYETSSETGAQVTVRKLEKFGR
ncbi:MAG TPA: hypothetical protein VJA21_11480 [Verrucomicrobiae bacterium]